MKDTAWNETSTDHREHIKSHVCTITCVSWGAIILGAFVAVGLSFLLNLLSLALGLSAFPDSANGQTAFAISGFVILVVFSIIAMFPAGWIAGYLGRSNCLKRKIGELYGLGTWALALILTIMLASYAGQFLMQSNYLINRNAMVIKLTDDVQKPAVMPARTVARTPSVDIKAPVETTTLGAVTFVTFFIFFIGLLASCFGGRMGMSYKRKSILNNNYCPLCRK